MTQLDHSADRFQAMRAAVDAPVLFGIYHTDREYAKEHGDPILGIVAASSKEEAESKAKAQGIDAVYGPWANPLTNAHHLAVYNQKVVVLDYVEKKQEFKWAAIRCADNMSSGTVGYVITPNGEQWLITRESRRAKRVWPSNT